MDIAEQIRVKFPQKKAQIQAKIDEIIAEIRRCDPAHLLAYARMRLTFLPFSDVNCEEDVKWRALEYIQSLLVTHKQDIERKYSVEDMPSKCCDVISRVEDVLMEMLPFSLFLHSSLSQKIKNKKHIDFVASSQMMSMVRGRRDVYFQSRYFRLLLSTQDSVFNRLFGITSHQVICGIEKLIDVLYLGKSKDILAEISRAHEEVKSSPITAFDEIVQKSREKTLRLIEDIEYYNVCKITGWPVDLIHELTLTTPETDAPKIHEFESWPIGNTPIKNKPFIEINRQSYCFDYFNFVDNIYHALLNICRSKFSRKEPLWYINQARAVENAVCEIFANLLPGCRILQNVSYRPIGSKDTIELDAVVLGPGITFVIEAKGIDQTRDVPIENHEDLFKFYERSIKKASEQSNRFKKHLDSVRVVQLFDQTGSKIYESSVNELGKICRICVSADSPNDAIASTMKMREADIDTKELICLTLDDLLVYEKYFENEPMRFIAYMSRRLEATRLTDASLSDELDHLGFYINNPEYVEYVESQMKEMSNCLMMLDDNRRELDDFFTSLRNPKVKKPELYLPLELNEILNYTWRYKTKSALTIATLILDQSDDEKNQITKYLKIELERQYHAKSQNLIGNSSICMLINTPYAPRLQDDELLPRIYGMMLKYGESQRPVITIEYDNFNHVVDVSLRMVSIADMDYESETRARQFIAEIDRRVIARQMINGAKIQRNDPCPCGSGKKYKKCCMNRNSQ